ncbi:hypothetical protein WBG06_11180 [Nocardioides sp. CCNWLW239]|uniref:hypothetical protein n=1 Tax=Nocardioides sp. CCNWLW239 TaxID=3128902 RepID=UPI003018EB0F
MGAAIISGLFAVALACLAWMFKNGSRRARLLSRIERYTQVLKDLPDGHPARAHLDAALAADSEQLLALTGRKNARATGTPAIAQGPGDDLEDPNDIDWMGDEQERRISPPDPPARPPRRAPLSGHGATVLWVLAALSAVATVGLVVNDLFL